MTAGFGERGSETFSEFFIFSIAELRGLFPAGLGVESPFLGRLRDEILSGCVVIPRG